MRAIVVDRPAPEAVPYLAEIDAPVPVMSEALIDVHAASINPIDWKTAAGLGGAVAVTASPWVPGNDFAGKIAQVPFELSEFAIGDRVFGIGGFPRGPGTWAEQTVATTLQFTRMPANLSYVDAAAVPVAGLTAWDAIVRVAKAHSGQRLLIHAGAGGVGSFAVQLAKYFGAWVAATASTAKQDYLLELGADQAVDYTTEKFEEVVDKVDVVVDLVGNVRDDTGSRSLNTLRSGGLYLNIPTGSWPEYPQVAAERGFQSSRVRVEPDGANLAILARLIEAGDVRVDVSETFTLDQIDAALELQKSGHTRGKVVLKTR